MVPIDDLRRQILDVEGFDVLIASKRRRAPGHVDDYPYVRSANHDWTCAQWKTKRFAANYDGLTVDVLDIDGTVVHGRTELDTIRNRWRQASALRPGATLPMPLPPPSSLPVPPPGSVTGSPVEPSYISPTSPSATRRFPRWAKIAVPVAALAAFGVLSPKKGDDAAVRTSPSITRSAPAATTATTVRATAATVISTVAVAATQATTVPPATLPSTTTTPPPTTVPLTAPPAAAPATAPPTTAAPTTAPPTMAALPSAAVIEPIAVVPDDPTDPRFNTCKEAKAHGYGHYRQGQDPEYDWYRDADHDGVVCE